jgi:hypothetical protein
MHAESTHSCQILHATASVLHCNHSFSTRPSQPALLLLLPLQLANTYTIPSAEPPSTTFLRAASVCAIAVAACWQDLWA